MQNKVSQEFAKACSSFLLTMGVWQLDVPLTWKPSKRRKHCVPTLTELRAKSCSQMSPITCCSRDGLLLGSFAHSHSFEHMECISTQNSKTWLKSTLVNAATQGRRAPGGESLKAYLGQTHERCTEVSWRRYSHTVGMWRLFSHLQWAPESHRQQRHRIGYLALCKGEFNPQAETLLK